MTAKTATVYEPGYVVAGKYELEAQLGQGGMGVVWRARNIALDAPVAIKVVRATKDQALLRGRLMQEARAAAKLTHPAIVKVFDVGQTDAGDPFIVMELLQGDSLGQILEAEGRLPAVQAVRTLLPIVDALWLAHTKGIVHRDLKPDNVFIVQHEGAIQPTLVDFGIVKLQDAAPETHLTQAGDVLGSPDYMSPEQARGQDDVGHLTDVWSICVVLYEAIAGRPPFSGSNYNALLRQIVEDTPPSLRELAASDEALSAIVMRGLSKQPEDRFGSMGALGRALAGWLLEHGVTEDICGSTLEAKWMRGTDPHGRAGRATLASINDGWPLEGGSGVRSNALRGLNTLPAPARAPVAASDPVPGSVAAHAVDAREDLRPKLRLLGIVMALLVLGVAGFALGKRLLAPSVGAVPADAAASATATAEPLAAPAESAPVPVSAESTSALPEAAVVEKGPPPVAEKVFSPSSSQSGKAHRARPAPPAPKKAKVSSGKAPTKPGDLISPY
jgi:serine/threonine-protein kinase